MPRPLNNLHAMSGMEAQNSRRYSTRLRLQRQRARDTGTEVYMLATYILQLATASQNNHNKT